MYSNISLCKFTIHFIAIPIVWLIIYGITASYTYYIYYNDEALESIPLIKKILSIIFYFCAIMTLVCHTMAMYVDPGTIDEQKVSQLTKDEKDFCKKCQKYRPLRAHHCSTCKKCIMKLDHHCPWIFNCVGYGNQKIFFLFLFYGTLGCFLAFLALVSQIISSSFSYKLRHPKFRINFKSGFWTILVETFFALSEPLMLILGTALSISMTVGIGSLFASQIFFISRNTTGVEHAIYKEDQEQNPWYAKTDRWFMFKTVMGLGKKWKWFFPIVESNKYNSGYYYDTPYPRIVPEKKDKKEIRKRGCCKKCFTSVCCCFA